MNFYALPEGYTNEIDFLERSIEQFVGGELHPTKFRAIRVPFGVYEQRRKETFMVRIRATAGGITPRQLGEVSALAYRFGRPLVHLTTRQEVQLHDIRLTDIPEILRKLQSVGLSSRGGGGNSVRNIMASADSGINPVEVFDVTPHAVALSSRLIAEKDSWNFPRKFKISFSSTSRDNALAAFNDLGFVAAKKDGRYGFAVYVAGGMGCRPRLSKVLHEFIEEAQLYRVCAAVKNLYLEFGNRKTKNSGRLRFLWDELGEQRFREIYAQQLENLADSAELTLDLESYQNRRELHRPIGLLPKKVEGGHFTRWQDSYVTRQPQRGLCSVTIPLQLGDIRAEDGIKLCDFLGRFGENLMRLTMNQNILIRNFPENYLSNLYELICEIDTLAHLPAICGSIIACTGADTCTTGVCLPRGVVPVIQKYLASSALPGEALEDLRINISGCPNSCGQHHIGDLGFFGRVARKNGKSLPGYWVMGGASTDPETRAYGEKCGWVASRDLPSLLMDILERYAPHGEKGSSFKAYFHNGGREELSALCNRYTSSIPDEEEDQGYYVDWGAAERFTTAHMGHGECSAGIYDMIEVSMKEIREAVDSVEKNQTAVNEETARNLVYHSASMLLVTRGVDPQTEEETYREFIRHFLDTTLVESRFRVLLDAALQGDFTFLREKIELVTELGKTMIQLYHRMDNRLKFTCEVPVPDTSKSTIAQPPATNRRFKDLRGVACPMNFVKTKVELAAINIGERLTILLDDGEPFDNVPRSVKTEGHTILSQEKEDEHWVVVIEKAS